MASDDYHHLKSIVGSILDPPPTWSNISSTVDKPSVLTATCITKSLAPVPYPDWSNDGPIGRVVLSNQPPSNVPIPAAIGKESLVLSDGLDSSIEDVCVGRDASAADYVVAVGESLEMQTERFGGRSDIFSIDLFSSSPSVRRSEVQTSLPTGTDVAHVDHALLQDESRASAHLDGRDGRGNKAPPAPWPMDAMSPLRTPDELGPVPDVQLEIDDSDSEDEFPQPLCPFCDSIVPRYSSGPLASMFTELLKKTRAVPLPWNPAHREGNFEDYLPYCLRHEFDRNVVPRAVEAGWLFEPDFSSLWPRVLSMLPQLWSIVKKPDTSSFFRPVKRTYRAIVSGGAGGMYATFRPQAVGYYGGTGQHLILFMLLQLFSHGSLIDHEVIAPLPSSVFISEVLVPEVAVRLIQGDLDLLRVEALDVMEESTEFGNFMHPGDGDEEDDEVQDIIREVVASIKR